MKNLKIVILYATFTIVLAMAVSDLPSETPWWGFIGYWMLIGASAFQMGRYAAKRDTDVVIHEHRHTTVHIEKPAERDDA